MYSNHLSQPLHNESSFVFNLYVSLSIIRISPMMLSHCLWSGATDWSQFLVMAFFGVARKILIRYWSPLSTVPSICPKYRTRQVCAILYPSTSHSTAWIWSQKGCYLLQLQNACMIRIHAVAQSPAGLSSVHLLASNLGRYKKINLVFPSEFSPSMWLCSCLMYFPHIIPYAVRDLFPQFFSPFSFDIWCWIIFSFHQLGAELRPKGMWV